MKRDIPAVVNRIVRDLFLEDIAVYETRTSAEVRGDLASSHYEHHVYRKADVAPAKIAAVSGQIATQPFSPFSAQRSTSQTPLSRIAWRE